MATEFLRQRDQIDRTRRVGQIHHARVNAPVRIEQKVFGLQVLGSLVIRKIVEQDRAEDGALSFYVRWKSLRGDVISGGHLSCADYFLGEEFSSDAKVIVLAECLWMTRRCFGKRMLNSFFRELRLQVSL